MSTTSKTFENANERYHQARKIAKGFTMFGDRIKNGWSLKVWELETSKVELITKLCDKVVSRCGYSTRYHFYTKAGQK
jgi:hypothetical protein